MIVNKYRLARLNMMKMDELEKFIGVSVLDRMEPEQALEPKFGWLVRGLYVGMVDGFGVDGSCKWVGWLVCGLVVFACVCVAVGSRGWVSVSVCVCACLCLCFCLSVCLTVCLSICLTVCLSVSLSVCLSLFLSLSLSVSLYLSASIPKKSYLSEPLNTSSCFNIQPEAEPIPNPCNSSLYFQHKPTPCNNQ